jgi:hypothetical protein
MVFQPTLVLYARVATQTAIKTKTRIATTGIMITMPTDPVHLLITALHLLADLPEVMTTPEAPIVIATGTTTLAAPTEGLTTAIVTQTDLTLLRAKAQALVLLQEAVVEVIIVVAAAAALPEGLPDNGRKTG